MAVLQDLRRDAVSLIAYKQLLDHRVVVDDDPVTEDEVHLLSDMDDENRWVGYFTAENTGEKIYEVSFVYEQQKFYLTEYMMRECIALDPKDILYAE